VNSENIGTHIVSEQIKESVPKLLSLNFKKLLCKYVSYYNGQLHQFSLDEAFNLTLKPENNKDRAIKLLIVSRAFYNEQAKEYPVDNKAELTKLLKLEYAGLSNAFYRIWGSDDGKSQINRWQFNAKLPSALITLPESLLLSFLTNNNQILQANTVNGNTLFVGRVGHLIHSSLKTPLINSSQNFSISAGVAQAPKDYLITSSDFATQIATSIKSLPLPIIADFIQLPKAESKLQILKKITVPFFLMFTLYLVASSAYLLHRQHNIQQKLDSESTEVTKALSQQQLLDRQFTQYSALTNFIAEQQISSPLWLVIAEFFPTVKFNNIQMKDNRVVLRGSTDKATTVLESISKNKLVLDAKFDAATRKSRKKEIFVISFKLNPAIKSLNKSNQAVSQHNLSQGELNERT